MVESKCRDCSTIITVERTESFCPNCGLVADESPVNLGHEITNPEKAALHSRTGPPITWLDPGIGSTFNPREARKVYTGRRR